MASFFHDGAEWLVPRMQGQQSWTPAAQGHKNAQKKKLRGGGRKLTLFKRPGVPTGACDMTAAVIETSDCLVGAPSTGVTAILC